MEKSIDIIDDLKGSITVCKWKCRQDIEDEFNRTQEPSYIIYKNLFERTCIEDMDIYFHFLASYETKKCLIVPKKKFKKLKKHIKFLINMGDKDEAYQIGEELNKLYPDFNFFDL